jgi:hypothetical protein
MMSSVTNNKLTPPTRNSKPLQKADATAALIAYCHELADDYTRSRSIHFERWLPALVAGIAFAFAFSLMYIKLTWFFFGLGFAIGGLVIHLICGDSEREHEVRDRLIGWSKAWPIWEYVVTGLAIVSSIVMLTYFGLWIALLFGVIVGVALVGIFYLAISSPLAERRDQVRMKFQQLVSELRRHRIGELEIEGKMPSLLGSNWPSLFESQFGYGAYRSIAVQIAREEPSLLGRRRWIRDAICDSLAYYRQKRLGPLGTAIVGRQAFYRSLQAQQVLSAGTDEERLDLLSDSPTTAVQGTVVDHTPLGEIQRVDDAIDQVPAGSTVNIGPTFNINAVFAQQLMLQMAMNPNDLSADNPKPVLSKKQKYDAMLEEARSASPKSAELIRRERLRYRIFGDETRLTIGLLLFAVFVAWLYQCGLFGGALWGEIRTACNGLKWDSIDTWHEVGAKLAVALVTPNASIFSLPISGWGVGLSVIVMLFSTVHGGWRMGVCSYLGMIAAIVGTSATLIFSLDSEFAWYGIATAIVLLVVGYFWRS